MPPKEAAGVRLGRPATVPQSMVRGIQRQRVRGDSFRAIAADLDQAKVATAQGGKRWYAATVRHVLLRTFWSTSLRLGHRARRPRRLNRGGSLVPDTRNRLQLSETELLLIEVEWR